SIGFGTDWSGLVSAWLTEWERKGPKWQKARARVLSTMETIAAQPNGFVQGSGLYDLATGRFAVAGTPKVEVSHLSAVFGLNELCAELVDLTDPMAAAGTIGELKVAVVSLLAVLAPQSGAEEATR
ncbi:hypothetical protein ADL27_31905, partial [Streptomyces sp. NRRL F-6602]